ncbi:MAG: hypothetical protein GXP15_01730 [Gammaproteobacteria bacterium]|nr:hypothetical protein [Gammaproteobacteria bacterium]
MIERRLQSALLVAYLFLVVACGSGGSAAQPLISPSTPSPTPSPTPPPIQEDVSYVELTSEAGDVIGGGQNYSYTTVDSEIFVSSNKAFLKVRVEGQETWFGDFRLSHKLWKLEPGTYENLGRYPFYDIGVGGMEWLGSGGRGCNDITASLTIDRVVYFGTRLTGIDLQFEQFCDGSAAALRGEIHWNANDNPDPAPVQNPPPIAIPAGEPPQAGSSFVSLKSDLGDYVGNSLDYNYTNANSEITIAASGAFLNVSVHGDEVWSGDFQLPDTFTQLEEGSYVNLERYPFHVPAAGGMDWGGDGRGCNTLNGWFVIDQVTYDGPTLTGIDLRFEQYCEGNVPALRGEIHWDASDTTSALGRLVPPPDFLWKPAPGVIPATGNFVYMESERYEWVGAGANYMYTGDDSVITANAAGPLVSVSVFGDEWWSGNFRAMNSMDRIEPGYYPYVQRDPFQNPTKGGLDWSGEGRGCNRLTGWFVVDEVIYDGDALTSLDIRFEQHCEAFTPALYGAFRWDATDMTEPPGPVMPPPLDLWEPVPGATPSSGNYVYLVSEVGDWVGQGGEYVYTPADSQITVEPMGMMLQVTVDGAENWQGKFQGMDNITRLEVGYYGDLQRYLLHNPAKGGLDWSGVGRGCNKLSGWFVVDNVTYDRTTMIAIDLRFEQRCDGAVPALNGEIHWSQ